MSRSDRQLIRQGAAVSNQPQRFTPPEPLPGVFDTPGTRWAVQTLRAAVIGFYWIHAAIWRPLITAAEIPQHALRC